MVRNLFRGFLLICLIFFFSFGAFLFYSKNLYAVENAPMLAVDFAVQSTEQVSAIITIEMFVRDSCKHCAEAKVFLENLALTRNDFRVVYRNLDNQSDYELWQRVTEKAKISKITPIIFASNTLIQGFDTPETTGAKLIALIDSGLTRSDLLTLDKFIESEMIGSAVGDKTIGCAEDSTECFVDETLYEFDLPFFGKVDLKNYSLPVISFVLGLIDGFNPCAMWVLVTFLIVLLQVGNRRRMWQIAGLFILAEAIMYYFILTLWFTTWNFIKLDAIITPIVGFVAIGGGVFFLYEWRKSNGDCVVVDHQKRSKIVTRIKNLSSGNFTVATFLGIVGLALSVNVIEFACSIGIPQAYTKIIEINMLGSWEVYANMLVYILAYMIDDLLVFGIALFGMDKLHLTNKYSKASNLIGGVLMIILGLMLIFAREWLVF